MAGEIRVTMVGDYTFRLPMPQRELLIYSKAPRTISDSAFLLQFNYDRHMIRRLFLRPRFFIDLAAF
jgi:hypothetical protein